MLSRILQILLFAGACITALFGIVDLTIQLRQKPFSGKADNNGTWNFGSPGFHFKAFVSESEPRPRATDTVFTYTRLDSAGNNQGSGEFHSRLAELGIQRTLPPHRPGEKMKIDTTVYLFGQITPTHFLDHGIAGYSPEPDGSVLYTEYSRDSDSPRVLLTKRYPTMRAAYSTRLLEDFPVKYAIDEEGMAEQTLVLHPKGWGQRLLFAGMSVLKWASASLLLFGLSFLFRNFGRRLFFDPRNTRILFRCGWLLILPELAAFCFYWLFLIRVLPAKLVLGGEGNTKMLASYTPQPFMNWSLFFLGLGLLALTVVFRRGHRMKENVSLTM